MVRARAVRELKMSVAAQPGRGAHVAAASGAVRCADRLYVISDDERALAELSLSSEFTAWRVLPGGALPLEPKARKARKPDFEALVAVDDNAGPLLALPSGSAPARFTAAVIPLDASASPYAVDVSLLYSALAEHAPRLNIEGAVLQGPTLTLLHRGNAAGGFSALLHVEAAPVIGALNQCRPVPRPQRVRMTRLELPTVGTVPLTPTDGVALGDGRLLLSAVAEATDDPYLDGACVGAALVRLERDGAVQVFPLDRPWKVEGVTLASSGSVLMVTDADDPLCPAMLLEAELPE